LTATAPLLRRGFVVEIFIIGHRQVTDAYLAQLARAHGFRLATFDQAIAKLHHDVAELVPDR
jgi:predicted nucleic acid-binding protein